MHVRSGNGDSGERHQRPNHSKKNGTSRFRRSRLNQEDGSVAVLLGIPLVANDGSGACAHSATKQRSFNPATGLVTDDTTQGRTGQTSDDSALLGVRAGRGLAVGKGKRDDSGCDG